MTNLFKKTVKKYNLIKKGDRILIGLSGGADSVCLALLLREIKEEYDLTLSAVHINHLLRGEEADRDMNFCIDFCEKIGIPLKVYKEDIKSGAKSAKKGIEEFAREKRYEIFKAESKNGKIATAHNLDDVAETLIFNITRGASLKGISSIPAKRDNIIRPLIETPREKIEQYLKEKNQTFVVDSTNNKNDYSRNKIRNLVIPVLKEINPAFLESVLRIKLTSEDYNEYFYENSQKLYKENISASELLKKPKAEVFEFIKYFVFEQSGLKLDSFHLEKCFSVLKDGGKTSLPESKSFTVKNNKLFIEDGIKPEPEEFSILVGESVVKTPYNIYTFEKTDIEYFKNNKNVYNLFLNSIIDCDKICDSLILRNRRAGDTVKLKNRPKKQIKSLYNEKKIVPENRFKLAVLESAGEIIWAEGIGVCDKYLPDKNSKNLLIVKREADYH